MRGEKISSKQNATRSRGGDRRYLLLSYCVTGCIAVVAAVNRSGEICESGSLCYHRTRALRAFNALQSLAQQYPVQSDLLRVIRDSTRSRSEEHTSELQSRGHIVCR